MTHHEQLLRSAYRRTGLALLGMSFGEAMAVKPIRITLECAVRQQSRAPSSPEQKELFGTTRMAHAPAAAGNTSALTGQPSNRTNGNVLSGDGRDRTGIEFVARQRRPAV